MIPTTFFLFVLLFFHGAYSHPTDTSLGKRGMKFKELKSVNLQGKEYEVKLLSSADQGKFSDAYEIIEPINNVGAILKVVSIDTSADPHAMVKLNLELKLLKKQGLLLLYQSSDELGAQAYYIVVRDLRKNNPPYRPFYEWYIDNTEMDAAQGLRTMREVVRAKLSALAAEGIFYEDYHMSNVFVDRKLEDVKPIDWGPVTSKVAGAIEVPPDNANYKSWLDNFNKQMEGNLLRRYSVERLKRQLEKHGSELRSQDEALAKGGG